MNAARTAARSSTASPAAVVPPGDVTFARSTSAESSPFGEEPRRSDEQLAHERGADVAARPAWTPASISASATRNRYAGPDPERPGHRVERGLRHPDDRTHRTRGSLRPTPGRPRPRPRRARSPRRPRRRARACWASPAPRARPARTASTTRRGHAGGDRQEAASRRPARPRPRPSRRRPASRRARPPSIPTPSSEPSTSTPRSSSDSCPADETGSPSTSQLVRCRPTGRRAAPERARRPCSRRRARPTGTSWAARVPAGPGRARTGRADTRGPRTDGPGRTTPTSPMRDAAPDPRGGCAPAGPNRNAGQRQKREAKPRRRRPGRRST